MTIGNFRYLFKEKLKGLYPLEEIGSFERLAFSKYTAYTPAMLVLQKDELLAEETYIQLQEVVQRLLKEEPIQYIIGDTLFYGLSFKVTPATLIPRPETEELVDWILKDVAQHSGYKILDIGTGSGCIAIALQKNLKQAKVAAYDISDEALTVARENALMNETAVLFEKVDILKKTALEERFDCIVSNPPYVRLQERTQMKSNVLDYEPHQALFVPNEDALLFYRRIGELAKTSLVKNGCLFFEINQYLGETTVHLLKEIGFKNVLLKKDVFGNDRMIKAML